MFSKNIRSIYLYCLCFISILMVIGGAIFAIYNVADLIIDGYQDYVMREAIYSLAFIIVGLPIYIISWKKAQKDLKESDGE